MAANDDERFFVMFAADDIKELTIDQLDDAYRLDVIDDSTMIWQEGFERWKTLSEVLAGGDDEDDVEEAEPVDDVSDWADVAGSAFQPQTSLQPRAVQQIAQLTAPSYYPSGPASQHPAPSQRSAPSHGPASSQYPAQSQYPQAQQQLASQYPAQNQYAQSQYPQRQPASQFPTQPAPGPYPTQSQYPQSQYPAQSHAPASSPYQTGSQFPGQSQYPFAPNSLAPVAPLSTRGVSLDADWEPEVASPWFRRLLFVAAAAGALVVLQRGGIAHSLAKAVDQGKSAEQLEAKVLGSPAVDTPRGLEAKLNDIENRYQLDHLSYTDPVQAKPNAESATAPADKPSSAESEKTGSAAAAPAAAPAAAEKPAEKSEPAKSDNAFARALSGKPAPKAAPAARPAARPSTGKHTKLGVGTNGGDPNDPMNGKL